MSDERDLFRIDRSVLAVGKLSDQGDEKVYWRDKTPLERLEALELIRQVFFGYDPVTARLQRVLEVAQRTPR